MEEKAKNSKLSALLATAFIALGILIRLSHLAQVPAGAPFRLGGLFYEFSRQIIASGYALPKTIPFYSLNGIPFAYPPLGFYVQALIVDLFSPRVFGLWFGVGAGRVCGGDGAQQGAA